MKEHNKFVTKVKRVVNQSRETIGEFSYGAHTVCKTNGYQRRQTSPRHVRNNIGNNESNELR